MGGTKGVYKQSQVSLITVIPNEALIPSDNPIPIWKKGEDEKCYLSTAYIYGVFFERDGEYQFKKNPNYNKDEYKQNLIYDEWLASKMGINEQLERCSVK